MKLFIFYIGLLWFILQGNSVYFYCLKNEFKNRNSDSIQFSLTENSKLISTINLKEEEQSHKKSKVKTKALKSTFPTVYNEEEPVKSAEPDDKNKVDNFIKDMSDQSHLFEGWIKYFKYSAYNDNISIPKNFIFNRDFYKQRKIFPFEDFNKKNSEGKYEYIRDEHYFFLSILHNSFVFNSSKKAQMQKVIESFSIQNVNHVWEDPTIHDGGIIDFGNFDEGYCLKFITKDLGKTTWVICFETIDDKDSVLKIVRYIKIKDQRSRGEVYIRPQDIKEKNIKNTISGIIIGEKSIKDSNIKENHMKNIPIDGNWVILQEWSQCNLKCGGGTSTLHRFCIPPKNGGKPCIGEAIIHRPCNIAPCPRKEKVWIH